MFNRICSALHLGALTAPPQPLKGGYTHRMFRVDTEKGRYAVKLLNPEIMQRPDALDNFRTAENCEALLETAGLPILPALTIGGHRMQQVEGQYLYVFDYFDGRALGEAEITPAHSAKMGEVLARIHGIDRWVSPDSRPPRPGIDWDALAHGLDAAPDARVEAALLREALPLLKRVTARMEEALRLLPPASALCHNDMDSKNVLWQGDTFRIIDLECLGYADPRQEMLDLAISWAGKPAREDSFCAFVSAYMAAAGEGIEHPGWLFDSRCNYIDWLVYNARRACFDDPAERRTGREQIRETIGKIESDQRLRPAVLAWLDALRP